MVILVIMLGHLVLFSVLQQDREGISYITGQQKECVLMLREIVDFLIELKKARLTLWYTNPTNFYGFGIAGSTSQYTSETNHVFYTNATEQ